MRADAGRLKLAELSASLGAGVLGAGMGVLLGAYLAGLALPILAIGLALHAWGMVDKHRLERGEVAVWWSTALYWLCWIGLAGFAVYALARLAGAT